MLHAFNRALDQRLSAWKLPPSAWQSLQVQRSKLAAIAVPEELDASTQQMIVRAIDESFVSGFRIVMAIGAALAIASAGTALALIAKTPHSDGIERNSLA
jgi:hypothetical protein